MDQPELGLKVAELRGQKNLTQEQLAEKCEVSTRTVQRIESGEVDPRAYTLRCLSEVLDFDFEDKNNSENIWLVLMHLSSVIPTLIVPLLIWSCKKNQSGKIDVHGRQVLNFQITMMLLLMAILLITFIFAVITELGGIDVDTNKTAFALLMLCVPLPMVLVGIFCTFQGVLNAARSLADKTIHYPLSISFVK